MLNLNKHNFFEFRYKTFHASSKYNEIMVFSSSNLVIQMIVAILFYAKLVCKCPLIVLLTGIMFIFQFLSHKVKISPKWLKKLTIGHILDAISFTYFILGTKIHLNKAHLMIKVTMTKVTDPSQISKSWPTSKKMGTTRMLFYPKTS